MSLKMETLAEADQNRMERDIEEVAKTKGLQRRLFKAFGNETDMGKVVDYANALRIDGKNMTADDLRFADAERLSEQKIDTSEAARMYLEGRIAVHLNFGGAATRMGLGSMYAIKVKELAKCAIGETSELTEEQQKEVRKALKGKFAGKGALDEYRESVRKAFGDLDDKCPDPGMGPRQAMALRALLERIAFDNGKDPEEMIAQFVVIFHVNDGIVDSVVDDLRRKRFYGFRSENVYILADRLFKGYGPGPEPGRFLLDEDSLELPPGHGYALEQLARTGQVRAAAQDGALSVVENESLLDILVSRGVEVVRSQRINDLTMWTEDVVSLKRLAYFLRKMNESGAVVGVELVNNPHGQKGGSFVQIRNTERKFLAETICLKSPGLRELVERAGKRYAPYNAFRNYYWVGGLKNALERARLPRYLRCKGARLYTETVTGDVTQIVGDKTAGFVLNDSESIHDFKEPGNLEEALRFIGIWEKMMPAKPGAAA